MARSLKLSAPSSSFSGALDRLAHYVLEHCRARDWLDLVEREYALMLAKLRLQVEQKRAAAEAIEKSQPKTKRATR